jgi:hypothetical protein
MALNNNMQWDVRTGGADTNGGAFLPGASGTDFSQQNSPNSSGTLGTAAGTTAFSDAGHSFTSSEVGNTIHINSGSGFTAGFYQVISVSTGIATLDSSPGTGSAAVWSLGGSMTTFAFTNISSGLQNGNTVWVQSGTYSLSAVANSAAIYIGNLGSGQYFTAFIGYASTHGDGGTKPLLTTSSGSVFICSVSGGGQSARIRFENISMSSTAGSPTHGLISQGNGTVANFTVVKCKLNGFNVGIFGNESTDGLGFANLRVVGTEIENCTSHAISNCDTGCTSNGNSHIDCCYLHNNGGAGFDLGNRSGGNAVLTNNVMYANLNGILIGTFVSSTSSLAVINNDISDSTGDGILFNTSSSDAIQFELRDNIIYNNAGYGVKNTNSALNSVQPNSIINKNNAYGANTNGTLLNMAAGTNDVSLSADPFTARASANFVLNSTAGGGASCKGAGSLGVTLFGTGSADIGALQSGGGGGGGGGSLLVNPGMSGGIRG